MKSWRLFRLSLTHLRSAPIGAAFAVTGVAIGVGFLVLFVGVGEGLRTRVLNDMFPADRVEFEPRRVKLFGIEGSPNGAGLSQAQIMALGDVPGVSRALGKQRSSFPAKLWGGARLLGFDLRSEAFFDGLPQALMAAELRRSESRHRQQRGPVERCDVAQDCPAGSSCRQGACTRVQWHQRFHAGGIVRHCSKSTECESGQACLDGRCDKGCRSDSECSEERVCGRDACDPGESCHGEERCDSTGRCAVGHCHRRCKRDADCGLDAWCNSAEQAKTCEPIRCRLKHQADARRISSRSRGVVTSPCEGDSCRLNAPCPHGTYCAADNPATLQGFCERPVPVVVNPLLMEIFNSDMAGSLNLPRVADPQLLYGQRFHIAFGDSHFTEDAGTNRQQIKQAVVVGFSPMAPELGVALPLPLVRHHNRRIRGGKAGDAFDSVWVQTDRNEHTAQVIKEAEAMGLSLSRRSRFARTLGRAVYVLYVAMLLLGLLVLSVSASNITQTLAMLVHERRAEIAILRALGGASWDVAAVILAQGAVLGLVGSTVGVLGALALGEILQGLIRWLQLPLLPQELVLYPHWLMPAAFATGLAFCLLGAILPARRAIRLDPSEVLSQP